MKVVGSLALSLVGTLALPVMASTVTLDFEGISSFQSVGSFYDNPADAAHFLGVSFSPTAVVENVGDGPFNSPPSGKGVMYLSGTTGVQGTTLLSYSAGFTGNFSFYYASLSGVSVDFYSNADGSGTLLGHYSFAGNQVAGTCAQLITFCIWSDTSGISIQGVAESAKFTGASAQALFDNITFNPAGSGGGGVPEPGSLALVALALVAGLASGARKSRA